MISVVLVRHVSHARARFWFSTAVHLVPRPYHPPVDRFVTLPPCLAFGIMVKGKAAGLLYDGAPIRGTVGLLSLDVPVIVDAPAREPQRPLGGSLGQLLWSPATSGPSVAPSCMAAALRPSEQIVTFLRCLYGYFFLDLLAAPTSGWFGCYWWHWAPPSHPVDMD